MPSRDFWNWNIYSNGVALASNLELPRFKEIAIAGDHGVGFSLTAADQELAMPGKNFLTWSEWRLDLDLRGTKRVHLIKHPYVDLIHRENIRPERSRRGTLVFVPHSVPGLTLSDFDIQEFVRKVHKIPDLDYPLAFSLHSHDIGSDIHKFLRRQGQVVLTAGDSLHPNFVYRFFEMAKDFKFACSSSLGSQALYLHFLGLGYFLIPETTRMLRKPIKQVNMAPEMKLCEEAFDHKNLFELKEEKDSLVARGLGISGKSISNKQTRDLIFGKSL